LPGARDWALATGIRQHFNTTGSQISLLSASYVRPLVRPKSKSFFEMIVEQKF